MSDKSVDTNCQVGCEKLGHQHATVATDGAIVDANANSVQNTGHADATLPDRLKELAENYQAHETAPAMRLAAERLSQVEADLFTLMEMMRGGYTYEKAHDDLVDAYERLTR